MCKCICGNSCCVVRQRETPRTGGLDHRTGSSQFWRLEVEIEVLTGFASGEFPHPALQTAHCLLAVSLPGLPPKAPAGDEEDVCSGTNPVGTGPHPLTSRPSIPTPRLQHRTEAREDTYLGQIWTFNTSSGICDTPLCTSFSHRRHLS